MRFFKYIDTIPDFPIIDGVEGVFQNGDEVKVRKGTVDDYRFEVYKVAADGVMYPSSITSEEWDKLDQITQDEITKLIGLDSQSEIETKINTAVDQSNGVPIEISGTVLPQGSQVPSVITVKGMANLYGGMSGTTYTQTGGSSITVSQGKFKVGYYDRPTNIWTASTLEYDLPQVQGTNVVVEGGTNLVNQDGVFKNTYVRTLVDLKDTRYIKQSDLLDGQINQMSYAVAINGMVVNNTSGILPDASSIVLKVPIEMVSYDIITDKTAVNVLSAVFLDINGEQLKPTGSSNYVFTFNANGTFTPPAGAYYFVTNIKAGTFNILTISGSSLYKTGVQKDAKIKDSLIPDPVKYTNMLNKSPNLFDKTQFNQGYINTADGTITNVSTSKYSKWIRLDDTKTHVSIGGRNSSNGNIRFSADGATPMLPVTDAGDNWTNYSPINNGKGINDVFRKPATAKWISVNFVFSDTGTGDNVMIVDGSIIPDTYQPFGYSTIKDQYLPKNQSKLTLEKVGNNYNVYGKNYNGNIIGTTFVNRLDNSAISNPNFNLTGDYINGVKVKESGDDVPPVNLFGSQNRNIGGNHGWSLTRKITLANHGKTVSDIGSVYGDTVLNEFVIMRIVDVNNIIIGARNKATDGFSYTFPAPNGTLTYNRNGTNTASISSYVQAVENNFYNTIKRNYTKILVDDKIVSVDGTYYGSKISVIEDYNILDFDSVLAKLISNRPSGGYLTEPMYSTLGADVLINQNLSYNWNEPGKIIITLNTLNIKKLVFNHSAVTQVEAITSAAAKLYIPKSMAINSVDYRLAPVYTSPPTEYHFTKDNYWQFPDNPPDRVLNFIPDNFGIHVGYLTDVGSSRNRKDIVNDSIFLSTGKKIYPKAVTPNGQYGLAPDGSVMADTFYSITAFRNIVDMSNVGSVKTSYDYSINGNSLYVFVDYHKDGNDNISIPVDFINKNIEVLESYNVTLLSSVSNSEIKIKSTSAGSYGYIKLKIIK